MSNTAIVKAISKIHVNLTRSLDYIANPEKTEKSLFVSGMGCSSDPFLAAKDFKRIAKKFNKNVNKNINNVLAHHYVISFNPDDNVSPEDAHKLSLKVLEKFLGKKYKALVATHVDKEKHIHTHFIFNSTGNYGRKYRAMKADLVKIKEIVNDICKEHNLTLVKMQKGINKSKAIDTTYKEWLDKEGIVEDKKIERIKYVEDIIKNILKNNKVKSIEELEVLLKNCEIQIKYKNSHTKKLYKHITFKSNEWEKGFRGKYNLSLENILEVIEKGENRTISPYEKWCNENYKESYKEFIKEAVDKVISLESVNRIEDLVELLKNRYNIQMDYLSSNGKPLKRVKFIALGTSQKNKIGSISLDKNNREIYEYVGLQERCSKQNKIKFNNDLVDNLRTIQKYLIGNDKQDKWGLEECIDIALRKNLRTNNDIHVAMREIGDKISLNIDKIKLLDNTKNQIERLYDDIVKYTKEYKRVENEIDNLQGLSILFNKKKLTQELNCYENKINELKNSQYYSDKKYSDRMHEITDEKYNLIQDNRDYDHDIEKLSQIEYIETHKELILGVNINYIEKKEITNDLDDTLNV